VLEHRTGIELLVFDAKDDIKQYLSTEFSALLNHPGLENTLPGIVDAVDLVMSRIQFISEKC